MVGSPCGGTLSGLPGSSTIPLRVSPGYNGSSMVTPIPHAGFPCSSTDVLRNARDVRSPLPFNLGFSFFVEVGVNLTNPVDSGQGER